MWVAGGPSEELDQIKAAGQFFSTRAPTLSTDLRAAELVRALRGRGHALSRHQTDLLA
jgi:hypothetical protein